MESKKLKLEEELIEPAQEGNPPPVIISKEAIEQALIDTDLEKIKNFDTSGNFEDLHPKFIKLCQELKSDCRSVTSQLKLLHEKIFAKMSLELRVFQYTGDYLRFAHFPHMGVEGLQHGVNQILKE